MNTFIDNMKNTMNTNVEFNNSITENGAVGFATSGKALLDLNFEVASLRSVSDEEIISKFSAAYCEDPRLAIIWLFYARDIREGLGERRLFRVVFKYLFETKLVSYSNLDAAEELISLIAEYGRYDDMYSLVNIDKNIDTIIASIFSKQLNEDIKNMNNNKSVSLLAKWLKSEKASSKESKRLASWTMAALNLSAKEYRKTLSALRKYIDVTEVKMCDNDWSDIDYSRVPSKANLNYKQAFIRHDRERYSEFINKVNAGEVKINAGTLYPHDIVARYSTLAGWSKRLKELDPTLEALWKNLPNTINGKGTTLVVADGSGSMMSPAARNSTTTALDVANALAIYFAERASGPYKDKYITFSSRPQLVDFSKCDSLRSKLLTALSHNEIADTNIEKVFDLILKTAIDSNAKQEDIPANILIISDMEFNQAVDGRIDRSLFESIAVKYKEAGYKLPRLVFWNVNSRTNTIPVIQNELGVALVSGFSVNIAKMVMDQELDPYKCLLNVLSNDRYKPVLEAIEKISLN